MSILRKAQAIVSFFARSSTGHAKLVNAQKHLAPEKNVLKLIQNVDTRWNSQHEMLARLLTLRKALSVVLCDRGLFTYILSKNNTEIDKRGEISNLNNRKMM